MSRLSSSKAMSVAETGWSAGLSAGAVLVPLIVLGAAALLGVAWFARKALVRSRRVPCPACGESRHPDASVCPHCKAAISTA